MKKKFLMVGLLFLAMFTIVACKDNDNNGDDNEETLTTITFEGIDPVSVAFEEEFNILDGVRAKGNDGKYYDTHITFTTTSSSILEDGTLDTTATGVHAVRYEVGGEGIPSRQQWRNITVLPPQAAEGEMLVNPDFEQGLVGWEYLDEQEGGVIEFNFDTPKTITAQVTAGNVEWSPRLTQMNVPFEKDKTYVITYEGRADETKPINVQAGHILAGDPWFIDFDNIDVIHTLEDEWQEFSWYFTHLIDNKEGGILFELGKVQGKNVNTTVQLRNIKIVEAEGEVEDNIAPAINGVKESALVPVGYEYDHLDGVLATDNVDGDITNQIVVSIKKGEEVVTSIDTEAAGVYQLEYSVEDSSGNKTKVSSTVEVKAYTLGDSLIAPLDLDKLPTEQGYSLFLQNWGNEFENGNATLSIDKEKEALKVDVVHHGAFGYSVKLINHDNTFEKDKTYLLEFDISASVDRNAVLAVGYNDDNNNYYQYGPTTTFDITTTTKTIWLVFTVTAETSNIVEIGLELGNTTNAANGVVYISDLSLRVAQ